jgi:hypothetical protein
MALAAGHLMMCSHSAFSLGLAFCSGAICCARQPRYVVLKRPSPTQKVAKLHIFVKNLFEAMYAVTVAYNALHQAVAEQKQWLKNFCGELLSSAQGPM